MSNARYPTLLEWVSKRLDTDEPTSVRVTPSVPFEPILNGEKGLLAPGYHVSHPIYRGHTDGTVTLPSGQTWVTRQVATLKHAYGLLSVQSRLSTYTRVSTFVGPSTLNWYVAKATNGQGV